MIRFGSEHKAGTPLLVSNKIRDDTARSVVGNHAARVLVSRPTTEREGEKERTVQVRTSLPKPTENEIV